MLCKITHLFRISRPLDLQYGREGNAFGSVGLVCSEKFKEKEMTLWMNGTAFGKTAQLIATMPKGSQIFVEGKLSTDSWIAKDGSKKTKTALTIERFQFVDKRSDIHNDNVDRPQQHNVAGALNRPTQEQVATVQGNQGQDIPVMIDSSDIPF